MSQLKVIYYANEKSSADEGYALTAYIADATLGIPLTQEVEFRDLNQVRAYYNGWTSALGTAGVREIVLAHTGWPFVRVTYDVPAFLEFEMKVPA
jgi:hypothetical protein